MAIRPTGHKNKGVEKIIYLLHDWLMALEENIAETRLPDPLYVRPNNKPNWTEEDLNRIINAIDEEVDKEAHGSVGRSIGATIGPDFKRLPVAQKLALVQQIETIIEENKTSD